MRMKSLSKNTEQGSAHVIIIVVLVVALIGALGFMFWQNFMQEKPVEKSNAQNTSTESTKPVKEKEDTKKYVVLDVWGVKFDAPDDGTQIKWVVSAEDRNYIGFSTSNLEEKDICTAADRAAGAIGRSKEMPAEVMTSPPTPLNDNKPIGGYYYWFGLPNGSHCDDQDPSDYSEAKRIQELAKTLRASS